MLGCGRTGLTDVNATAQRPAVTDCRPMRPPPRAAARLPDPLSTAPRAAWGGLAGVLTDIDDTITRDGAIEPVALQALRDLAAAGLPVIAVTGRPTGWSEPFAAAWPVTAIVAENGAVALWRDAGGEVQIDYAQDAPTRRSNAERLQVAAAEILTSKLGPQSVAVGAATMVLKAALEDSHLFPVVDAAKRNTGT